MNLSHFRAVVWLRWRLLLNQINRLTPLSRWFLLFILAGSSLLGFGSFVATLSGGGWLITRAWTEFQPQLWNRLVISFLIFFMLGTVTGFKSESGLSLQKILSLPMSPFGAYLLNVIGLLLVPSVVMFLPSMVAFCLVMSWRCSPQMLLSLPLLLCFLAMTAALSMLLRTWLIRMCEKKWSKWLVLGIGLALLIGLLFAFYLTFSRAEAREREILPEITLETAALRRQIMAEEFSKVFNPIWRVSTYLPHFWLVTGIDALGRSNYWLALASAAGMTAITAVSLQLGYRGALRICRRDDSGLRPVKAMEAGGAPLAEPRIKCPTERAFNWLDMELSWLNPQAATVAILTLRHRFWTFEWVFRMVFILAGGIGLFWFRESLPKAEPLESLLALGIGWTLINLAWDGTGSEFTADGTGFRALLLAPLREEDILLGKNAAAFIQAIPICAWAILIYQLALNLSWSHFLASLFQLGSLFLVICHATNLMSIYLPLGAKVEDINAIVVFWRFLVSRIILLAYIPMLLPLGLESLAGEAEILKGVPIYLCGAAGYFVVLASLYWPAVCWEAALFRKRKWKVLEVVTSGGN